MPNLYANAPTVTHSLDGFTERLNTLHNAKDHDGFIKTALTGQYCDQTGSPKQIFLDPLLNRVDRTDDLSFSCDYDSVIGISNHILVDGPISLYAIPHPNFALTTSIHLQFPIERQTGRESVALHRIPNFELGTFSLRHQLHVFFPALWSQNRSLRSRLSKDECSIFYEHGIRPAIRRLLGDEVVSQWPASVETEEIRARKRNGQCAISSRLIPQHCVGELADAIRQSLRDNQDLPPATVSWASRFFIMHTIRGVKHGYLHSPSFFDSVHQLGLLFSDANLADDAPSRGKWWVDVGVEISSNEGHCLQWITASHWKVVQNSLQVDENVAKRITSIGSSKYSRDLSSHLTAVSGFRITPGVQAAGDFNIAYLQAYTTDKTVVYSQEGIHHAKYVSARDALGTKQPSISLDGIHTIYEAARLANGSNARLEVRVPYAHATNVLLDLDEALFRESLCSFTRDTWWNFRIIRLMAISQTFTLQEDAPAHLRFTPEALLLTAACLWLVNSLHARPEDGPAARNLMRAVFPVTEDSEVICDVLAYNTRVRPDWEEEEEEEDPTERRPGVPYNPYGVVFFWTIMLQAGTVDVPRFVCGGPSLSDHSFAFLFDGMSIDNIESKFKRTGFISREAAESFKPMNKKVCLPYIPPIDVPQPTLFDLGAQRHTLEPPARDEGSDLEDSPPPEDLSGDIDAQISSLWRQFVHNITYKAPNQRGMENPSHMCLGSSDRLTASEEPYKTLNLSDVFNGVYYKKAPESQWRTAFNWLFPPPGQRAAAHTQNYRACQYYNSWLALIDNNRDNGETIQAIREKFFQRIREWRWMPFAQSDRIWLTSAKKPCSRPFTRWPPNEGPTPIPAPHILLHSNDSPTFTTAEGVED